MRSARLAALVAALSCNAATAQSQSDPELGSRVTPRTMADRALARDEGIRAAHTYARCIYATRDRTVRRWLTATTVDEHNNAAEAVFKTVECEWGAATTPWLDSMMVGGSSASSRGTLAEAALRKDGRLAPRAPVLPTMSLAQGYKRPYFELTGRGGSVDAMAMCFAETQPALTVKLLQTKPTSPEEKVAIGEVAGQLAPCLIGGATLKANAFMLRGALAEAYFQRIYGQASAPQTPARPTAAERPS